MNKQHKCIKFTFEIEFDNSSSFLDIEIIITNNLKHLFTENQLLVVCLVIWINHISHYCLHEKIPAIWLAERSTVLAVFVPCFQYLYSLTK